MDNNESGATQSSLQHLFSCLRAEVPLRDRTWMGMSYPQVLDAKDIVDWIVAREQCDRQTAVQLGRGLQKQKFIVHVWGSHTKVAPFKDMTMFFRFEERPDLAAASPMRHDAAPPIEIATSRTSPVLVTGAGGYVASHCVSALLNAGYHVRGTVRHLEKAQHLRELPGADRLELVEADLLKDGAFDAACQGCHIVLHTASPYKLDVPNPERDLVEPAVFGTLNVLRSCERAQVKRVVLTSSYATITDSPRSNVVYTEADWNVKSSLTRNPYYYSKTVAERAAWAFVDGGDDIVVDEAARMQASLYREGEGRPFQLVVLNPGPVIGPSFGETVGVSAKAITFCLSGGSGVLDLSWAFVDVRDVAKAHLLAMTSSSAAGKRHILVAGLVYMEDMCQLLLDNGYGPPRFQVPSKSMGGIKGNVLATGARLSRRSGVAKGSVAWLSYQLGRHFHANMSRAESLGVSFTDVEQSVLDTVQDMDAKGQLT